MNAKRIEEIMSSMNSFSKEVYHKSEILDEMLALQSEVVNLTFNDKHAETAGLKLYDVVRHFEQLNDECGHVADDILETFTEESKLLCNMIKIQISGNRGETRAFRTLEYLKSQNIILKNVELEDGDLRTELDAIVITPKCITIVEVKNTGRDIFIDETGNYYRTGKYLRWDCDIARKMSVKEKLVRKALADAGIENIKIQDVVVFTNNRIEVQNKYSKLKTCFVSQLASIIDDFKGDEIMDENEMIQIQKVIEDVECKEYYPAEFNAEQFKMDFATLMTLLETVSSIKKQETEAVQDIEKEAGIKKPSFKKIMKSVIASKYVCYAGIAAAGLTLTVISGVVINNTLERIDNKRISN